MSELCKDKAILVITGVLIAVLAVTVIWCLNSQFVSKSFSKRFVKESDEIENHTEKSLRPNESEENKLIATKYNSKSLTCGTRIGAVGSVWDGKASIINSWPWIVAFQYLTAKGNKFFCAGSLVSDKHIVSAAHCFQEKYNTKKKWPGYVTALIGKHNLSVNDEEGSEAHRVFEFILHEDWDYEDYKYDADISLVVLETRVDLSKKKFVGIVCLPPINHGEVSGIGTIVGWGISEKSGYRFDVTPNEVPLPAVSQSQCLGAQEAFKFVTSNRTFCAGYVNQEKTACQGDSGGGLYSLDRSTKAYTLIGISSASLRDPNMNPCRIDTYSIFTDVGKFANWIEEKIEETKETKWKPVEFECTKKLDHKIESN